MSTSGRGTAGSGDRGVNTTSFLTCPSCHSTFREEMPEDRCVVRYTCPGCEEELRPEPGDCCVFCSYGSSPCPPEQGT